MGYDYKPKLTVFRKEYVRSISMKENSLLKLSTFGQSAWLDFISLGMISSGELQRLIENDGICGVTSNPAIFEKAIAETQDYDHKIQELAVQGNTTEQIYHNLTVQDIQLAADLFRDTYERTDGRDGLVSLEVSPHIAHDTATTITEARRLWDAVERPNVMIKVPGTAAGLPAIEELLGGGVNVNVTLLFGLEQYRRVAETYLAALEKRARQGFSLRRLSSVASFFLSRIDTLVDALLDKIIHSGGAQAAAAQALRGQTAIAQAKMAYGIFKEVLSEEKFAPLAAKGAAKQRLLWASTSTKNPAYSDVMYVEDLIGPETVTTLPLETIEAYRDHGKPAPRLEEGMDQARQQLTRLAELGISMDQVVEQLEEEGVQKFIKPYDALLNTLERARDAALG
jgi:transaldolase